MHGGTQPRVLVAEDESSSLLCSAPYLSCAGSMGLDASNVLEACPTLQREKLARHSSGLGLTFSRIAVEAQSGTTKIDCELGSGSVFWIRSPSPLLNRAAHNTIALAK